MGPAEALKLLDLMERKIQLPTPAEMADDVLAADQARSSLTPEEDAALKKSAAAVKELCAVIGV